MAEGDIDEPVRPSVTVKRHEAMLETQIAGVECDGCHEVRHQRFWTLVWVTPHVPGRVSFWFCSEQCTHAFVVARSIEYG